jgi:exonuclease III
LGTLNVGLGFLRKLPRILTRCAELTLDVVALQEIGDPALLSTRFPSYLLAFAAGPSVHEGVGLLLSLSLAPRIRRYFRSDTGRLVGAVLELSPGHSLLLVSAYMPSGLDHAAPDSPSHRLAHTLYAEMIRWSAGVTQIVVMGDLNETRSPWERFPRPPDPSVRAAAAAALASPLSALQQDGFTDVYRHMHPSAEHSPGFTHVIDGVRPSRSRLDYIWCKGLSAADLLHVQVDPALRALSHHRLLWAEMRLSHAAAAPCTTPLLRLRLPNLRATEDHKTNFAAHLQRSVLLRQAELLPFARSDTPDALHRLAAELTQLVHRSAFVCFPITGSAPHSSASMLQLSQQRRDLTRLLRTAEAVVLAAPAVGDCLIRSPLWLQQYTVCTRQHGLQWRTDAWYGGDPLAWLAETRQLLSFTRAAIRAERRRMERGPRAPVEASPAALIHRMLKSDALPSHLHSVVDAHGSLTSTAAQLEEVMVDHFREVFAVPPPSAAPLPHPPPAMLLDKDSVQAAWFDGLMAPMGQEEIMTALSDAELVSSPGEDEVSTGLWKLALAASPQLCLLVSELFSACLRTSIFPSAWKVSVIVPLIKNEREERTMSNVRPISLQSCLGKLFTQVLALRLGSILVRFPVLHPAQRGFIFGGSTSKS